MGVGCLEQALELAQAVVKQVQWGGVGGRHCAWSIPVLWGYALHKHLQHSQACE